MSYMDLMKFAQPASNDAAPAAAQAPEAQPAAQAEAPSTSSYGGLAKFAAPASAPVVPSGPISDGSFAEAAEAKSPLSLMDRAMLGWVRTPEEQVKLLKGKFEDAKMAPTQAGQSLVVKQGGKWFQADPNFEWKMDADHAKELAGDVAQFAGEYGLRTIGATAAGAAAVAAAPVLATAGATAAAAAGIGLAASALGSMGAEALDLGSRQVLLPENTVGKTPYKDAKEVSEQMNASALFGMYNFAGEGVGKFVAGKAADALGHVINNVISVKGGKAAVKKILGVMGADELHVDARLANPLRNAAYDKLAAEEAANSLVTGSSKLDKLEDVSFSRLEGHVDSRVAAAGQEFAALKADPKVKAAQIDISQPLNETLEMLHGEGYLKKVEGPNGVKYIQNNARELGAGDSNAIERILTEARRPGVRSYDAARMMVQDLGTTLNKLEGGSDVIYGAVTKLKVATNQSIGETLGAEAGSKYGSIMNKYSIVKSLSDEFSKLDSPGKKATFLKRLSSPDRNGAKTLVKQLVDAGVPEDSITDLLQIQGARSSTKWFTGTKLAGIPVPTGGKLGAKAISVGAEAADTAARMADPARDAMMPYLDYTMKSLRRLKPEDRACLLRDPNALFSIHKTIQDSALSEASNAQQLLQKAGISAGGNAALGGAGLEQEVQ